MEFGAVLVHASYRQRKQCVPVTTQTGDSKPVLWQPQNKRWTFSVQKNFIYNIEIFNISSSHPLGSCLPLQLTTLHNSKVHFTVCNGHEQSVRCLHSISWRVDLISLSLQDFRFPVYRMSFFTLLQKKIEIRIVLVSMACTTILHNCLNFTYKCQVSEAFKTLKYMKLQW